MINSFFKLLINKLLQVCTFAFCELLNSKWSNIKRKINVSTLYKCILTELKKTFL